MHCVVFSVTSILPRCLCVVYHQLSGLTSAQVCTILNPDVTEDSSLLISSVLTERLSLCNFNPTHDERVNRFEIKSRENASSSDRTLDSPTSRKMNLGCLRASDQGGIKQGACFCAAVYANHATGGQDNIY